jgi:hypothetical protein
MNAAEASHLHELLAMKESEARALYKALESQNQNGDRNNAILEDITKDIMKYQMEIDNMFCPDILKVAGDTIQELDDREQGLKMGRNIFFAKWRNQDMHGKRSWQRICHPPISDLADGMRCLQTYGVSIRLKRTACWAFLMETSAMAPCLFITNAASCKDTFSHVKRSSSPQELVAANLPRCPSILPMTSSRTEEMGHRVIYQLEFVVPSHVGSHHRKLQAGLLMNTTRPSEILLDSRLAVEDGR